MTNGYVISAATFIVALGLTWLVRRVAIRRGLLDIPNARSSHTLPTPRGGGLAIVCASTLGVTGLFLLDMVASPLVLTFMLGGLLIAWVGFVDDREGASVQIRMSIHLLAAVFAVYILGGLPAIRIGQVDYYFGLAGDVMACLAIVWVLNLFNFMDGIDGLAASEAVFITGSGAGLALLLGTTMSISLASLVICFASLGFLAWNWPPARIFMGDVGSGFLGYIIAVLALSAARDRPVMLFVWLILGGVFFCDATVTLVRRFFRDGRVFDAHRSHAYQLIASRWNSHLRVTVIVSCINVFWLLPLAWICLKFPSSAWWISIAALAPLALLAFLSGAGGDK